MGDFYRIIQHMDGDSEELKLAQIMDEKFLKVIQDIEILGYKHGSDGNIDMRHYIERTDALARHTNAIKELGYRLLSLEGVIKRSKMLS